MSGLRPSCNQCPPGFEPKYRCIEPSDERSGLLACVAMIVGRPLDDVRRAALAMLNVPVQTQRTDVSRFAVDLLAHFGSWKGGGYDVVNSSRKLPDLAIVVTAAMPGEKLGRRHCLFHRQRPAPGQPGVEYLVDPYPGLAVDQRTRFDVGGMDLTHAMMVYWMEFSDDF